MISTKNAAVALTSLVLFGTANATPVDIGSVDLNGSMPKVVSVPDVGPFSNEFSFTLVQGKAAQVGLTSSFWGSSLADAPQMTFTLSGGSGAGIFSPMIDVDLLNGNFAAGLVLENLSLATTYYLTVAGSDASNLGTTYALQLSALNVPEPSSSALFLSSLGLLGLFVARRKHGKGEA